jgi:hypothetical protein
MASQLDIWTTCMVAQVEQAHGARWARAEQQWLRAALTRNVSPCKQLPTGTSITRAITISILHIQNLGQLGAPGEQDFLPFASRALVWC